MNKNPSYILVNNEKKSYTKLNHFNKHTSKFQGEYSIIHNEYTNDLYFLSRFLINHTRKPLFLIDSMDKRYNGIISNYTRFEENDISKYVDEKILKEKDQQKSIEMDRNLGQLQFSIIKGIVEKELESVETKPAHKESDHYIHIGQKLALEYIKNKIDELENGYKL